MNQLLENFEIDLKYILLPILYIIIGIIVYKIINNIVKKANKKLDLTEKQLKRTNTAKSMIMNFVKYIIAVFVVLAILTVYGIDVNSILAGLGISAVVLGLALQDVAKDIIAGLSILTENQFDVGDTIEIDGFMGEVIFLGLRSTKIRNYKGATKIIANHNINTVINYNLHDSLALVDVSVDYKHNPEEVEKVLLELAEELSGKIPNATDKLQVWGINGLDDSSMVYRVAIEVKPMEQFATERFIRKEIKKKFDSKNIKIPFHQVEVHNGK